MVRKGHLQHRLWIACLLLLIALLGFRLLYFYLNDAEQFPIRTIKIVASYQHISRSQLQQCLEPHQGSSFFTLNARQLYHELMAHPWAEAIDIERLWPDTLKITIKEKLPIAFFNQDLITKKGEVFTDLSFSLQLPRLIGPKRMQKQLLAQYEALNARLSQCHVSILQLKMRANQALEVKLDNGILLKLGKSDAMHRVDRFCKAYPKLSENGVPLLYVDLRYPNGMAVKWGKKRP